MNTPRTDEENKRTGWPSFYYDFARKLEAETSHAIRALEIRAAANEEAAKRSPQNADWSNGVAKGMREAIDILSNATHHPRQPGNEAGNK
jgi:hypothetical protein